MAMKVADFCDGEFKDLITIQGETLAADNQGGQAVTRTTIATAWAMIRPNRGYKNPFAGQIRAVVSHFIYIRYQPGILPTQRVLLGARAFKINGVIDIEEAHEYLELSCEEGPTT